MINILYILVEQGVFALDRPFYYYFETEKEVKSGTRVSVNFHNQNVIGFVVGTEFVNLTVEEVKAKYKGIKPIISLIDEKPIINKELFEVAQFISKRYVCPLISCLQAILPKSLKPSSSSKNAAKPQYFYILKYVKDVAKLTKKQFELLRYIEKHSPLKNEVSVSIAQKLLDAGCIRIEKVEKSAKQTYFNKSFETLTIPSDPKPYINIS
jgi:primosomal protein N' (replication factor Y)